MKKIIEKTLNHLQAKKVTYGDIRVVRAKSENLAAKNGKPDSISSNSDHGFGIRVIVNGCWGFASSSHINEEEMLRVADEAVAIAETGAALKAKDVELAPQKPITAHWENAFKENPFDIPIAERMELILEASAELEKAEKDVKFGEGFLAAFETDKIFANTEGAYITQKITESGGGIVATAVGNDDIQTRSYPNSFRGNFGTTGYEFVREMDFLSQIERVASEAVQLIYAKPAQTQVTDIVIDGSQMALQIHESCGHPIELDRVMGSELSYAGGSFMQPGMLNELRYGSDIVNIVADATVEGGLGSFGYDDDGVPAQHTEIIKNGLFVDYITSREYAPVLGPKIQSNGTNRADGWNRIPIIRMTNINLMPVEGTTDDLIGGVESGLWLETNRAWSIDDLRSNFQFTTEFAREINGGELGDVVKNATYTAITTDFWNKCDAIAGPEEWKMWGTPNCGKGQPGQTAHVGHGTSPARFREIEIIGS
ncbi:MAG: TldD/PmbA family protein [bacterium]|nr:TldD/PmbA family protein [bacterium]